MSVKQISVFLENKPGTLMDMTDLLAARKIDMRALHRFQSVRAVPCRKNGITRVLQNRLEKHSRVFIIIYCKNTKHNSSPSRCQSLVY